MSIVFSSAWGNITTNQRFSRIMVIGIALCTFICGVVTMIVLGSALEPYAIRDSIQLRTLQVGYAYLSTNSPLASVDSLAFRLPNTEEEISTLKAEISGIESAFLEEIHHNVSFTDTEHRYSIIGAFSYVLGDYVTGKDLVITAGRSPQIQNQVSMPEIMINQQLAESLLLNLNDTIEIDDLAYRIVGIYEWHKVSLSTFSEVNPRRQVLAYLAGDNHFSDSNLSSLASLSVVPDAAEVDAVMAELERRIAAGEFGHAIIKTNVPKDRLFPDHHISKMILTWFFYAGCLILGSILVIVNLQLNRIRELTREIALMKAIGVKETRILAIIAVQYAMLSIIGCLIALLPLMLLFNATPQDLKPFMNEQTILGSLSLLFVIIFTVAVGVIPTLHCLKTDVTLYRANRD